MSKEGKEELEKKEAVAIVYEEEEVSNSSSNDDDDITMINLQKEIAKLREQIKNQKIGRAHV